MSSLFNVNGNTPTSHERQVRRSVLCGRSLWAEQKMASVSARSLGMTFVGHSRVNRSALTCYLFVIVCHQFYKLKQNLRSRSKVQMTALKSILKARVADNCSSSPSDPVQTGAKRLAFTSWHHSLNMWVLTVKVTDSENTSHRHLIVCCFPARLSLNPKTFWD